MTDTQTILDTARYLREVRPIDPEEIYEYVEDQPHPAVVRQTLREHAVELGLLEREDGTFVPVADEPVRPAFDGVDRFPERWSHRLEDLLVERYGPGWPESGAGDRLRERIDRLKAAYFAGESVEYDAETAVAYAIYHLPDYYAAIQYVLDELARDELLPSRLRVLDVGAGVGGPALGSHDFLPADALVGYEAIEPSDAAGVLEHMLGDTRRNFHVSIHRESAEAFEPAGEYDLLVFANVFSELDDPVAVAERYLDTLAADGTLLALAPADRETATGLRAIERALVDDGPYTVYAPTVRLWPDESPADEGWTFVRQPDIEPLAVQRRLDEAADGDGTYVNADVQYAYLLLRQDDRRAIEYTPDRSRVGKLADSDDHVTERVDLVALKLSPDLSDDGNPLFKVGDGSEQVDHYAVLAKRTALNDTLVAAPYGALVGFENVLVLWNDDEAAYNLVVDDETVVDRLA